MAARPLTRRALSSLITTRASGATITTTTTTSPLLTSLRTRAHSPLSSSTSISTSTSIPLTSQRLQTRTLATMAPVPSTMKAISISENGTVDVLQHVDVPVPTPAEGQVLIKNDFCGVNFIDTYFRSGLYPTASFPRILGGEASGEVVSAGPGATQFKAGTRVVAMSRTAGTYAQYTVADEKSCIALPDNITNEQAAAVFLQGLTAWTLIRESAQVKAGQWTLVHAAAGGVGLLLVQMLRSVGAKVIGTASTEEKLELARKNGAEYTINSGDDVVAKVKEITGGHGIDAIFDGVGKATFDADLEMIALKGNLISFGNASGAVPPLSILKLGAKNVRLMRPVLYGYISDRKDFEDYSRELFEMVSSGKLDVRIHEVYPLADAKKAHSDLEGRKTTGKLLLKCNL